MKSSVKKFCAVCLIAAAASVCLRSLSAARIPETDTVLLETDAERETWLNLHGWRVLPPERTETRIPAVWRTSAGQAWLGLQHAQGFQPEQFAGESAVRYVYPVQNTAQPELYAELLLTADGILVGAQVYSAETGLMQTVL